MSKADPPRTASDPTPDNEHRLSRASVGRFSLYLRHVERLHQEGVRTVSSNQLGDALGITDAQVRKDLANLGNLGHRGVGYPTQDLALALRAKLGVNRTWVVVLVGVGNLARALLRYRGFEQHGFQVVALFDADAGKVGNFVENLPVYPPEQLAGVIAATGAELAILTIPAEVAQEAADQLVAAGIKGIMNFAPTILRLPRHVRLVSVDLAVQMEQLASLVHLGTPDDTVPR